MKTSKSYLEIPMYSLYWIERKTQMIYRMKEEEVVVVEEQHENDLSMM